MSSRTVARSSSVVACEFCDCETNDGNSAFLAVLENLSETGKRKRSQRPQDPGERSSA